MTDEPTLGEIGRTINRLERKMDRWSEDHEQRLRRVERWTYVLPPTFVVAVVGLTVAIVETIGGI